MSVIKKFKFQTTVATAVMLGTAMGVASAPIAQASSVWDRVAACESGGNWSINTGNGFYGGLQFTHQTWNAFGGGAFSSNANGASKSAQIMIASRVLASQGPGAWPVCSIRAGLSRGNGGAGGAVVSRSHNRVPIPVVRTRTRTATHTSASFTMSHSLVKRIQRWVGARQDGVLGPVTAKALQRKVHSAPDGIVGPITMSHLQLKIGMHRDGALHMNARTVIMLQHYLRVR